MISYENETIRQVVRERYAHAARPGGVTPETASACCACEGGPGAPAEKDLSSACCCSLGAAPAQAAAAIGYSREDMAHAPEGANLGLGCGNPVALASLRAGETVVDLGSGAGFDCFLAAEAVGDGGRVIGVDMTAEMVSKARENAKKAGISNVEFRLGEIEHLPVADNTADIIISNCVINLSPEKHRVFQDAIRVLRPGGRLVVSDILATAPLPEAMREDLALVSACIGGAATIEDTERLLKSAGFQEIRITTNKRIREIIAHSDIGDHVVSASIEAIKPACGDSE